MFVHRVPKRYKAAPSDYERECDRCGFEGYLRSELSKEKETGLIVCKQCLDVPRKKRIKKDRKSRPID